MTELLEFLNFIKNNISDERIHISKRFKYGFKFYQANIGLPTTNGRTITIYLDSRHKVLELSFDYGESLTFESEDLCIEWCNTLEEEYQKRLPKRFDTMINSFIEETDLPGKDFWRNWTMDKLFGKDFDQ
jgi:hypothetical protein